MNENTPEIIFQVIGSHECKKGLGVLIVNPEDLELFRTMGWNMQRPDSPEGDNKLVFQGEPVTQQ